jgi:hypothetical protein
MTVPADRWIRRTTIGCVGMLAAVAGTVSYLHMHLLVQLHGQPGWVAALTPLSVDGMIVAASTTLLAESRSGRRGGLLPWALLAVGSIASLAASVAVAEQTATGRVIAAWPLFALIASSQLLMGQVCRATEVGTSPAGVRRGPQPATRRITGRTGRSGGPTGRGRRHPPPGPASPRQPPRRLPAQLPGQPYHLQRGDRWAHRPGPELKTAA